MSFKKKTLWISFFTRLLFRLLAEPAIFSVACTASQMLSKPGFSELHQLLPDIPDTCLMLFTFCLIICRVRHIYCWQQIVSSVFLIHRNRLLLIVMDAHVGVLTWWLDLLTSCHKCAVEWHVFTSIYRNSDSFSKKWENELKNEDSVYTAIRSPVLQYGWHDDNSNT